MSHAWMPFYVADYLADTGHLTATEHGAYILLILHYWQKGSLPSDERMIARVARLSPDQWTESRDVLAGLFGEGWRHKRIDAELSKATEIVEKRKAAADARHQGRKPDAHALHVQSTSSDTGVPPSPTPRKKEEADASSKRARAKPAEFEQWYAHYPHKVQRAAAEKAFSKARALADLPTLIAGVQRYVESKPADRQWQNPATWLNGKGWMDAPAPEPLQRAASPPGKETVFDALADISRMKGWNDEPASLPGSREDAERLSAAGDGQHQGPSLDLRRGHDWH